MVGRDCDMPELTCGGSQTACRQVHGIIHGKHIFRGIMLFDAALLR